MRRLLPPIAALVCGLLLFAAPQAAFAQQPTLEELEELGLANEDAPPGEVRSPSGFSLRGLDLNSVLLVPNASNESIIVLDAETGDLIDPAFIVDSENLGTPKHAILNFDGSGILVSDQLRNGVFEYDLDGQFVRVFAPATGIDVDLMRNLRGIAIAPSGDRLWVTVAGNANHVNRGTVLEFDTEGNYIGRFIGPDDSPMTMPWDIIVREDDILITESGTDGIYRFTLDGEFIEVWNETAINFPQQFHRTEEGNILTATFSAPSGVHEFGPDGSFIELFGAQTGLRGVHELPNGNMLVTNSGGLHEITRDNELVRTITSGSLHYIQALAQRDISFSPSSLNIEIDAGTTETATFTMTNTTEEAIAFTITDTPDFISSVSPMSGSLAPEGSAEISVTFDATNEIGGTFSGSIAIETDDEDNGSYTYSVSMLVIGDPSCVISPDPVAFDPVIVGFDSTLDVTVTNEGFGPCTITGASTDEDDFEVDFEGDITLQPDDSTSFTVTFAPSSVGTISGTLSLATDDGAITAALTGVGQAAPQASADPSELSFSVEPDQVTSQTFTLSNLAGSNAADLDYNISIVQARPAGTAAASQAVYPDALAPNVPLDLTSLGFQAVPGTPEITQVRGGIDCEAEPGIIIQDDGTAENGYSGNPAVVQSVLLVDRYTPSDYPATVSSVCIAFITQAGGPSTMDFEVEIYAPDGPGGAPGTLLGSVAATATDIPAIPGGSPIPIVFQTVDVSELELSVESGDLYIGARWSPPTGVNVFLGADESTDRPVGFAGGYFGTVPSAGGPIEWRTTQTAYSAYRAAFIRPVIGLAQQVVAVDPASGMIVPGDSDEITVTVDATDLEPGVYEYEILIATNDPANPVTTVDVVVSVGPVSTDDGGSPVEFSLAQNYPNPFSGSSVIEFTLPDNAPVTLEVFDVTGRRVATLVDREMEAGTHRVTWEASGLASGTYLYRIQAGSFSQTLRTAIVN